MHIKWTMRLGVPHKSYIKTHHRIIQQRAVWDDKESIYILSGWGFPSDFLLKTISLIPQYLEIRMPFGQDSYVFGTYRTDGDMPIRCPHDRAINHFHCNL